MTFPFERYVLFLSREFRIFYLSFDFLKNFYKIFFISFVWHSAGFSSQVLRCFLLPFPSLPFLSSFVSLFWEIWLNYASKYSLLFDIFSFSDSIIPMLAFKSFCLFIEPFFFSWNRSSVWCFHLLIFAVWTLYVLPIY